MKSKIVKISAGGGGNQSLGVPYCDGRDALIGEAVEVHQNRRRQMDLL